MPDRRETSALPSITAGVIAATAGWAGPTASKTSPIRRARKPEPFFKLGKETLQFERHEGERRIGLRRGVLVRIAELVNDDVQELELAHLQVFAQHEGEPLIEHKAEAEHLHACTQVFLHFLAVEVGAAAAPDGAGGGGRGAQLALVAKDQAPRQGGGGPP